MMSKETLANNSAFRLFLVVVVALTILLLLSMRWNREATSTVVTPSDNEALSAPGVVRP